MVPKSGKRCKERQLETPLMSRRSFKPALNPQIIPGARGRGEPPRAAPLHGPRHTPEEQTTTRVLNHALVRASAIAR